MHDSDEVNTLFEIRPVNVKMKNMDFGDVTTKFEGIEWVKTEGWTRNTLSIPVSSKGITCCENRSHRWTITDVQACSVMADISISFKLPLIANSTIKTTMNKQMTLTKQSDESESRSYTWTLQPEKVSPYTEQHTALGIHHAKGTVPFTAHWEDDWPATTGNLEVLTYNEYTHEVRSETLFEVMEKLAPGDIKRRFELLPPEFKELLQEQYHGNRNRMELTIGVPGSSMPALVKASRPLETKKSMSEREVDYCALMRYTVVQAQPEGAEEVAECLANQYDRITSSRLQVFLPAEMVSNLKKKLEIFNPSLRGNEIQLCDPETFEAYLSDQPELLLDCEKAAAERWNTRMMELGPRPK